tara:strand:- start:188 stop:769 length:582 start_codon:yes stop_codon:yes gene_type:complete
MEKYVLVPLGDRRSKALAQALGQESSRKILDYLGEEKQASPKELSQKLDIPLSTVVYKLKQLEKSGLLEKKDFAWSEKGKKVHYYALAKKMVLIAPKNFDWKDALKQILPVAFVGALSSFLLKIFYGTSSGNSDQAFFEEDAYEEVAVEVIPSFWDRFLEFFSSQTQYFWIYVLVFTILLIALILVYRFKRAS